jgi:hypothetical protein
MASEDSDQFARLGLHLLLEEATFFVMTEPITQPQNSISLSCWFSALVTLSP